MILLTKHFDFEMAHALMDYPGKCRNIHGHSYKMEVTVVGETQPDTGMVMDFKHLKDLVNEVGPRPRAFQRHRCRVGRRLAHPLREGHPCPLPAVGREHVRAFCRTAETAAP